MNVLIATDLPDHVAQATSRCGILSNDFHCGFPSIPIPSTKLVKFLLIASLNPFVPMICLRRINSGLGLGISIPTTSVPGIGANILSDFVLSASVRSF